MIWLAHFMLLTLYFVLNEIDHAVDAPDDPDPLADDPSAPPDQCSPIGRGN